MATNQENKPLRRTREAESSELRQIMESNPIRKWRRRERISQLHAARLFNVSPGTVVNWESGAATPDRYNEEHLKKVIGDNIIATLRKWRTETDAILRERAA